jgi:thymidylate synthase
MNINAVWQSLLNNILKQSLVRLPRGHITKEIRNYHTTIDMNFPFLSIWERNIGESFRYAEAAWILSGDNRVKTISPYSKMISQFSDDGIRFFGSYGPKVVDQLSYVIDTLNKDDYSRQAVINIWREKPPISKDIPCTCSLQFILRDGRLNCIATMRSSDAWLGWPYDAFNFTCISIYILLQLLHQHNKNYILGSLSINAGSQHLYERDWEKAKKCLDDMTPSVQELPIWMFNSGNEFVDYLWNKANGKLHKT